jgi:hypothetical protein
MVPWQEASPNPIAGEQDVLLDISEQVQHMRDTAPPIVKTSGQAKAEKMMALFLQFVRDGERQLGRPFTVADLSDQWVQAMRLDILKADGFDLSDASELTPELLRKVAEYYCEESGNKLAEGKGQVVRPF